MEAGTPSQCSTPCHPPCTGFFTDAYDLYMVGVITPMIAFARFPDHVKGGKYGSLPDDYDLVVKGMALVGTLIGQVSGVLLQHIEPNVAKQRSWKRAHKMLSCSCN